MTEDIPPDTGSADPGAELREAARSVHERYKEGSPAYGFWRVTAGVWDRWAERLELGVELSPVAHAEFQAALFSARRYLESHYGGDEPVVAAGPLTCGTCGHVFISQGDDSMTAAQLAGLLAGHVCGEDEQHQGPA